MICFRFLSLYVTPLIVLVTYRRLEKRYLWPVQPRAQRRWMVAREQFTRGAATDSPPAQNSLRKQPRSSRRKQAEIGPADHSWHCESSTETEYKRNWIEHGTAFSKGVRRGGKTGIWPPLEIGTKKQKFLENLKSSVQFRLVGLILAMTVFCRYDTHTAQEPGSLFW